MQCKKCGDNFPSSIIIDGKKKVFSSRRFCLKCSPWGLHNTRKLDKNEGSQSSVCKNCGKEFFYDRRVGHRLHVCNTCSTRAYHRKKKNKAVEHFGGKCSNCGYNKCFDALEFHHLGDKEERATYVIFRWSWERAKKELEKCILICSNCHRELHSQEREDARIEKLKEGNHE